MLHRYLVHSHEAGLTAQQRESRVSAERMNQVAGKRAANVNILIRNAATVAVRANNRALT